jgi:hypothetical protein
VEQEDIRHVTERYIAKSFPFIANTIGKFWKDYIILTAIEIGLVTVLIAVGSMVEWDYLKNRGN